MTYELTKIENMPVSEERDLEGGFSFCELGVKLIFVGFSTGC